jgi:hypothetical protein
MSDLVLNKAPELQGVEKSKALQIKQTFEPMTKMLEEFENAYNGVIKEADKGVTEELTRKAKRLRLDIRQVRLRTEEKRKEIKEEYLRAGKAIDGVSNIVKWAVTDKEQKLKNIEEHFERMEEIRKEAEAAAKAELQEKRATILAEYVEDAHERDLATMDEDVWDIYLATKKKDYEDRMAAAEEARKKAEEEARKAQLGQERFEAVVKYSYFIEGLSADGLAEISAEEFDELLKIGEEKRQEHEREQERLRKEAEEARKREEAAEAKREAQRQEEEAEREKEREAERKRLREEQEKREKLEAELSEKRRAEEQAEHERREAEQKALSASDSQKVKALTADLMGLKDKYQFKSAKNKKRYEEVKQLLDKVAAHWNS